MSLASHQMYLLPDGVLGLVRDYGARFGVEVGGESICHEDSLGAFLGELVAAGGTWSPLTDQIEWHAEAILLGDPAEAEILAAGPDLNLGTRERPKKLYHAHGVFLLTLDSHRVLVAGIQLKSLDIRVRRHAVGFFGPNRRELVAFLRKVWCDRSAPRMRIWGGGSREANPPAVTEAEVVLPADLKSDLLGWLDRFWALKEAAAQYGLPLRRGVLLAGDPGTGKTQFVRHLLTRYPRVPAHLFIASRVSVRDDPFGDMIAAVRRSPEGAMVILEDIDRIAESGTVTKEFLLNCLDGFLELPIPLLWIATSNDPSPLERNLLARPGRFDRTVTFPLPGAQEREGLLIQFSRFPISPETLHAVVRVSQGLSGAHLRQACATATLTSLDTSESYDSALQRAIERMHHQHGEARRLLRSIETGASVGFGAAMAEPQ